MNAAELAARLAREVRAAHESGTAIVLPEAQASVPVKSLARSVGRIEHPRSRVSRPPERTGGFVVTLPPPAVPRVRGGHQTAALGLAAVGIGLAAVVLLTRGAARAAALPPGTPPSPPPPPPPPAPPASSPPSSSPKPEPEPTPAPGEPIANWGKAGPLQLVVLNSLTGYHRAKASEVGPQMKGAAASFLKAPVGSLHFAELDGKHYAVAVEEHTNHPEIGAKNKGVSIFVRDDA